MTIKEISKETGFSVTTVSRALNDYDDVSVETKKIIKKAAKRLNYVPNLNARRLATKNSKRIGFIILKFGNASGEDNFMYEVFLGILQGSNDLNYEAVIIPVTTKEISDDPNFLLNIAKKNDLCAMVLMGLEKNTQYYKELAEIKFPIACIDGDIESDYVAHISIDNRRAFYEITNYLINSLDDREGPLNFLYMSGRENTIAGFYRHQGFDQAISQSGRDIVREVYYGDYSEKKSHEIISSLIEGNTKVDGIVCANDMMAIGAAKAILENSMSIPEDIQITGCDNISLSHYTHPSISTVSVDKYKIGYEAVELLNNIINNRSEDRSIIIPHELIIRESTF